jgi:hypothetical protein
MEMVTLSGFVVETQHTNLTHHEREPIPCSDANSRELVQVPARSQHRRTDPRPGSAFLAATALPVLAFTPSAFAWSTLTELMQQAIQGSTGNGARLRMKDR